MMKQVLEFPVEDALQMIRLALHEDVRTGDITSIWTIPQDQKQKARLIAKESGVIAGLPIIDLVFQELKETSLQVKMLLKDGDWVEKGTIIAELEGKTQSLLTAERCILNFIQQLSGVATSTRACVKALEKGRTQVLDTRKTIPGFRTLQKYAVRAGGGKNHRMGLFDMVLIKDNHITASGGVLEALAVVKKQNIHGVKIEVEVESLDDLRLLLHQGVDVIMLDNMDTATMTEAVKIVQESKDQVKLEASGNMSLERLKELATIGLDYISVGALTHSVKALDISMRL
ncbi:MAG: carboxylating nicotinate-nucleotide diphosphorylase [Fibrobacter sp.]|jgi:nicotinate-nucleotide pyrophosphorylase (carboxylating)|nr:carboxylating nicotinate-nucleotide diphosphorylase [Fibrobacter sp.]